MSNPEEIKAAVLKECERLFYDPKMGTNGYKDMGDDPCYRFEHPDGFGVNVYEKLPPEHRQWLIYYRLLNLEAKEIELNLGLMTISRDNEKMLRESCEKALEGRDARIAEIQERAKGLVEILQETYACIAAIGAPHELDDEHRDFLLHKVDNALNQWKGGGNV